MFARALYILRLFCVDIECLSAAASIIHNCTPSYTRPRIALATAKTAVILLVLFYAASQYYVYTSRCGLLLPTE